MQNSVYSQVFDTAPDAILVVNKKGLIIEANAVCEKLLGYSQKELENKDLSLLIPPKSRKLHIDHVRNYWKNPTERPMENMVFQVMHKNGHSMYCEIALSPIKFGKEIVVSATVRNVSEKIAGKEHMKNLHSSIKQLEERIVDP